MKKEFTNKLTLNKTTVANLKDEEMKNLVGGANTQEICPTWFFTCDQVTCQGNTCVNC
jgi:natural product precursor